jgi:hypothetical protein
MLGALPPSPTGKAKTEEEIVRPHPSGLVVLTPSPSGEGYNKEGNNNVIKMGKNVKKGAGGREKSVI